MLMIFYVFPVKAKPEADVKAHNFERQDSELAIVFRIVLAFLVHDYERFEFNII